MGLDLIVREKSDFRLDEKGRNVYTTTELANLRNCWNVLDSLNWKLDNGFENCGTHYFYEGTFFKILKSFKEEVEIAKTEENEEQVKQLQYEISKLEAFIKENELQEFEDDDLEDDGREFEVHAWW